MARRSLLLSAVAVASAAVWVAAPDAAAQQPRTVVIALADDQTRCAGPALAAVLAALRGVEDLERAKREVVIVATVRGAQPVRTADGFTVAPYDAVSADAVEAGWLVRRGAYECPEGTPTAGVGETELNQLAAAGGWSTESIGGPDELQSLARNRFEKPAGGRNVLLPILLLLVLAAAAAIVIALVVRARNRPDLAPPPPPPPLSQLPVPPPPASVPSLGVTRRQGSSGPNEPAPKAPEPKGRGTKPAPPLALRPMTTLDGVVGSKLRDDLAAIEPERRGSTAVWPIARSGLQCTAIYTEKVAELGEDAEPSIVVVPERRAILLGVYDGLGGAGSAAVETAGGLTYNEAFVASRVAREEAESWFLEGGSSQLFDGRDLQARLTERLASVAATHLPARNSGVRSNLARTLPTTLAVAVLRDTGGELGIEALWAGDSRVFLLTPTAGLQQLTADHVRDADVLHQLANDSPMSNMVSASNRFEIATSRVVHNGAGVVLCATDGVFGYVRTPGEVECVLLQALQDSSDPGSWGDHLVARITGYTGDDATLAVAAIGFADFAGLKSAFAKRAADVEAEQHLPFANVDPTDHDTLSSIRAKTWSRYQTGYTALMPGVEHVKARSR